MSNETWTSDRLTQLADNEELVLVIARADKPVLRVPVWAVTVGGDGYVRSYRGVTSGWYRGVMAERNQAIALDEGDVDVHFESVDPSDAVNAEIDAAFVGKYATAEYRDAMITPLAIDATLRILPR